MPLSPKTYEPVPCVLCGPSQTQALATRGQFGWPTHVSICKSCGLVYLNPRWTPEDYKTFYANEYDQFYRFDETEAAEKEKRKARVVWKRLQEHAPGPVETALDIGCGLGWLLDHLRQQEPGLKGIFGIEPSDYCAGHFVNRVGGTLVARDVDTDWHLEHKGQFDRIVFRHVLEHLLDPVSALRKVHEAMSPDGRLYIAVPDMMHPDGSLADFWYRCVHVTYYSQTTLRRVAALAGLEPVVIREENSELWGIFRKAQPGAAPAPATSVYQKQISSLNAYKRRRVLRGLLRGIAPQKFGRLIPAPIKSLAPKGFREKFRKLVYRH